MRYLTSDYIFPISSPPIPNGIVVVDDEWVVEEVINPAIGNRQLEIGNEKLEVYKGIITPGFINSHCHLELSHLKGKLTEGKGLPHFIKEIIPKRNASSEVIQQAMTNAEDEMIANGIVGVGDICNTNHSFERKENNKLRYHNFIELFDLDESHAEDAFEKGMQLEKESQITNHKSQVSLTPHAPYTVSGKLLKLIKEYADANNSVLSIHNQETASENEMFASGKGELIDTMKSMVPVYNNWKPTGHRSLASVLAHLNTQNKILLVHNTYTTNEDVDFLNQQSTINNQQFFFCCCPNANLFIEKRLPDFQLFMDGTFKITVGTDSYASNWSLSVLDELKTIHRHAPEISLGALLQWATLNGAEFFGWDKKLGSIEKGKKPGLNLIENVDLLKMQLTSESGVKKIV